MSTQAEEAERYEYTPSQAHMVQVYRVYRYVDLNVRYYGKRASQVALHNTVLQGIAAIGTSATLLGLLAGWKIGIVIFTAAAALASILSTLLVLSEKIIRFEKLHYAYAELSADLQEYVRAVTVAGTITPVDQGIAKSFFNRYARLSALDEVDPNQKLIDKLTLKMEEAMPHTSFWMPSE